MLRSLLQLSLLGLLGFILSACAAPAVNDTRTYYLTDMERYQEAMRSGRRAEVPRWMRIDAGTGRKPARPSATARVQANRAHSAAPTPSPVNRRAVATRKPEGRATAAATTPRSSRRESATVKVADHRHTHYGRDEAYYERRPYYRPNSQYPVGKRRSDGSVQSPYTGARLPAQNIPSGARILDPSSGRVFINP